MSDARSCGNCIYFNHLILDCQAETQCMKDVDEAKYTAYIEGKKQGRAEVIDLIDRHLWNYSHEVWEDFKPILEQMMEQNK